MQTRELVWMQNPTSMAGRSSRAVAFAMSGAEIMGLDGNCCSNCWCKEFCICDNLDLCLTQFCIIKIL